MVYSDEIVVVDVSVPVQLELSVDFVLSSDGLFIFID
tara:strand:- start:401 stop:511 length:111 start_codon:yes stop_codon:yes gene_type:complete